MSSSRGRSRIRVAPGSHVSRDTVVAEMCERLYRRTNRTFVWLLSIQWLGAVVIGLVLAPPHLTRVLALYWAVDVCAIALVARRPTSVLSRHVLAVVQTGWALFIVNISGASTEVVFHAFVSLALLAFYSDWRVLVTATITSVGFICIADAPHWALGVEHVAWMLFANGVLVLGCLRSRREIEDAATREATLQQTAITVQRQVENRTRALQEGAERYRALVENTEAVPFEYDSATQRVTYMAPQAARMFDCSMQELRAIGFFSTIMHPDDLGTVSAAIAKFVQGERPAAEPIDFRIITKTNRQIYARSFLSSRVGARIRGITLDVTRQTLLEAELLQSQKLESVGRLAAGVAHEINTPIQYVGDNLTFTREAVEGLLELIDAQLTGSVGPDGIAALTERIDLPFLRQELPGAISRALDGVERVALIVRSMKIFAHPDQSTIVSCDLRQAIESALILASGEYKYVADVVVELDDVPKVRCRADQINQAVLNVVVNAAHAIGESVQGTSDRGTITVSLRRDDQHVVISIRDTGCGIPDDVRPRVFEQFFTTKPVGKGTGQGLGQVRAVIESHAGTVSFETEVGVGTAFHLRIPIDMDVELASAA